jgi:organic hydroperoxide reductase OsmC/OhrA
MQFHEFKTEVVWTGNDGAGTSDYHSYRRDHEIGGPGKPTLPGSADPAFRGDGTRHNPEELLVASLSTCHMLWYLHLCADAGVVVTGYRDHPSGTLKLNADGSGAFTAATLRPRVTITAGSDAARARELHADAHHFCFIAASVNFPVTVEPEIVSPGGDTTKS